MAGLGVRHDLQSVVIGGEFSKEEAPFALNRKGGLLSALGVTRDTGLPRILRPPEILL